MPRLCHAILSVLGAVSLAETASTEPVKDWKIEDFDAVLFVALEGYRDFENGERTFAKASCLDCHRFAGKGPAASAAPDLTAIGKRESPRDLLEAVLHPENSLAPGFAPRKIGLIDGRTLQGLVRDETGSGLTLVRDPRKVEEGIRIRKDGIVADEPAALSLMPEGLLDAFDEEDVLDLLAYLLAGGNPEDAMFRH